MEKFKIEKLYLINTPKVQYNDPYLRGYVIAGDSGVINTLHDRFEKYGIGNGKTLTEMMIAKELPGLINTNPINKGVAYMPNGWNESRLCFVLEVVEYKNASNTEIHYVQGYSEYYEPLMRNGGIPTLESNMDLNMPFHINSISIVSVIFDREGKTHSVAREKTQIIKTLDGNHLENSLDSDLQLSRPTDIINNVIYGRSINGMYLDDSYLDTKGKTTKRKTSSSTGYITETLNNVLVAKNVENGNIVNERYGKHIDVIEDNNVMSNAAILSTEYNLSNNQFLRELSRYTGAIPTTSFTLSELMRIDPFLNDKTVLFQTDDVTREDKIRRDMLNTDVDVSILDTNWLGNTQQPSSENLKAYDLYNMLSTYLTENMITQAYIYISNDPSKVTYGSEIAEVLNGNSIFNPIFVTPKSMDALSAHIKYIILPKLSEQYMFIDALVNMDVFGSTTISISINSGEHVTFRYNSSADGLYTPHITNTIDKTSLINDFSSLIDNITHKEF